MTKENQIIKIEKLNINQIKDALPLVWEGFCKYEAVNYPENGKQAFWDAIHDPDYLNALTAYGAFIDGKPVGIIALRNEGSHIALFFVDGKYHRQGIGRKLFETSLAENTNSRITVHSSEYAQEVYARLGFVRKDEMQEEGGIRYIPMEMLIKSDLGNI